MIATATRCGFIVVLAEYVSQAGGLSFAYAGAWTHEKETGYSSVGVQRDFGEYGDAWRSQSYLEYGATDRLTLVGKAETLWRDADGGDDRVAGLVAARRSFARIEGFVAALQIGVLIGDSLEAPLCEGSGLESRVLAGWSGVLGGAGVWVNAETGFRNQGGCGRWKTDLAAGVELSENWRAEAKAYHQSGDGPRSLKFESGLARRVGDQFLGVSYRSETGGAYEEDSWILTLSRRF